MEQIREEQKKSNFKEKIEMINEVTIYFSQLGYEYKFLDEIARLIKMRRNQEINSSIII